MVGAKLLTPSYDDLQKLNSALESFLVKKTIPSLGSILTEPVSYFLKNTQEISLANLESVIPSLEQIDIMSAVYVKCDGDVRFGVLLYLPEKESTVLATKIIGSQILKEIDGITTSSIAEMGNILSASIINAISSGTGYKIYSSVPGYAVEFLQTLLNAVVSDFDSESDTLIVSNVELCSLNSKIKIHLLFIQDPSEACKLMI